jgi:3-oxoacyl-[acyl-carrier protein] reductase
MNLGLEGRHCIVIGGSRGIGRSIALGLAAEGANVALCAREPSALRETEDEVRGKGVRAFSASCDAADPAALATFLESSREALGGVDVLIHNASALAVGPELAAWEASFRLDLMGAVHACSVVVPWMQAARSGSILFVTSIAGLEANPMPDFAYTSTKAALIALAKKMALLHAADGIRVNAVAPGSIEFPGGIWASVRERRPELYSTVRASIPWGRLGTPEEVADIAVYLVSPRAGWVTGECVSVDGGQHRGMR